MNSELKNKCNERQKFITKHTKGMSTYVQQRIQLIFT